MVTVVALTLRGREFVGKDFSFCNSRFSFLAAPVIPCKWNQPLHTPSENHVLDKGSIEKYVCRLQWYIHVTDQFSFKQGYVKESY